MALRTYTFIYADIFLLSRYTQFATNEVDGRTIAVGWTVLSMARI